MPWFVVQTSPFRESAAVAAIVAADIAVTPFCPMQRVSGIRGPKLYALLPRHLFAFTPYGIDATAWHAICASAAVRGILGGEYPKPVMPERSFRIRMADGSLGDMIVGADRIEEWRAQADADGVVLGLEPLLDEWRVGYAVGDVVIVDRGFHQGRSGIVEAIDRDRRATVLKIACNLGVFRLSAPSSDCTLVGKGRDAAERMRGSDVVYPLATVLGANKRRKRGRRGGRSEAFSK